MYVMIRAQGGDISIQFQSQGKVVLRDLLFDDTRRYNTVREALASLMPFPELTADQILAEYELRGSIEGDLRALQSRLLEERNDGSLRGGRAAMDG